MNTEYTDIIIRIDMIPYMTEAVFHSQQTTCVHLSLSLLYLDDKICGTRREEGEYQKEREF